MRRLVGLWLLAAAERLPPRPASLSVDPRGAARAAPGPSTRRHGAESPVAVSERVQAEVAAVVAGSQAHLQSLVDSQGQLHSHAHGGAVAESERLQAEVAGLVAESQAHLHSLERSQQHLQSFLDSQGPSHPAHAVAETERLQAHVASLVEESQAHLQRLAAGERRSGQAPGGALAESERIQAEVAGLVARSQEHLHSLGAKLLLPHPLPDPLQVGEVVAERADLPAAPVSFSQHVELEHRDGTRETFSRHQEGHARPNAPAAARYYASGSEAPPAEPAGPPPPAATSAAPALPATPGALLDLAGAARGRLGDVPVETIAPVGLLLALLACVVWHRQTSG